VQELIASHPEPDSKFFNKEDFALKMFKRIEINTMGKARFLTEMEVI
jgi:hypothetical protein